jgi:SNF2 family DNA or RNA helicase
MSIQLFPHQLREIDFMLARQSGLLASATGTGKTGTFAGLAARLIERGHGPILWVTPKSLLKQSADFAKAFGLKVETNIDTVDQDLPSDTVVITTTGLVRSRHDELWAVPFGAVLVDEIHQGLANPGSATVRALTQMCEHRHAYGASAEPVVDATLSSLHTIGQVLHLDGVMSGREYALGLIGENIAIGRRRVWKITGITDATRDLLIKQVAKHSIRHTLDDVVADGSLPALDRFLVIVPMSATGQAHAARAAQARGLDRHRHGTKASRDGDALVPAAVELLTTGLLADHQRVILFTENFDLLDALALELEQANIPFATIDGSMTPKARAAAVAALTEGEVRCLIGTSALETGLSLQCATALISVVTSWSPAREGQREGRIRRLNSTHERVVHVVVKTDAPIEDRRNRRIDSKDDLARLFLAALGDERTGVADGWTVHKATCAHGDRALRSGTSTGGAPWTALFCNNRICQPVWLPLGSGKPAS